MQKSLFIYIYTPTDGKTLRWKNVSPFISAIMRVSRFGYDITASQATNELRHTAIKSAIWHKWQSPTVPIEPICD